MTKSWQCPQHPLCGLAEPLLPLVVLPSNALRYCAHYFLPSGSPTAVISCGFRAAADSQM